jgi:hypothetical protein
MRLDVLLVAMRQKNGGEVRGNFFGNQVASETEGLPDVVERHDVVLVKHLPVGRGKWAHDIFLNIETSDSKEERF